MPQYDVCGISRNFSRLFPCKGQVAYALLTRAPVAASGIATTAMPLDLHVLSLSLAFILSQDQTLRCCYIVFFFSCLLSDLETASTPADGLTEGFRPLPSSCLIIALCQCSLLFFAPGFDRKASAKLRRVFHSCKFFRNFFQKKFFPKSPEVPFWTLSPKSRGSRPYCLKSRKALPLPPPRSRRRAPVSVLRVQR